MGKSSYAYLTLSKFYINNDIFSFDCAGSKNNLDFYSGQKAVIIHNLNQKFTNIHLLKMIIGSSAFQTFKKQIIFPLIL
jgi:hypothetical protein